MFCRIPPFNGYVAKNIGGINEIWATVDFTFDGVGGFENNYGYIIDTIGSGNQMAGVWWNGFFHRWEDDNDTGDHKVPPPSPPTLGTWKTLELHFNRNTAVAAYIDNTLLFSEAFESYNLAVDQVRFGGDRDIGSDLFIDNAKIGTTRGGSQIFSDNFESGNFSAWDVINGSPEITNTTVPVIPKPINTFVGVAFNYSALEENPGFVQIDDPNANSFDPGSSIDVVSAIRIDRGRASEFDKTGTGTASISLVDINGYIDPTNTSGPFYGLINPMKQVQVFLNNPNDDFNYSIFRGFASDWTYDVDVSGAFTRATLDCADAFDLLSALEMTPGHHGDAEVPAKSLGDIFFKQGPPGNLDVADNGPSRIHKALDDAGWGPNLREVFTGNVILEDTVYARRDQLLSVIFDAADAEFPGVANVYMNKNGYVTFHGRYARFNPTDPQYGIQFWKAGTGPIAAADATVAPISGLRFRRSKSDIINAAMSVPQIPGPNGGEWNPSELATMIEKDDASIAEYGWRSDSYDNLLTLKGRVSPDSSTSFPLDSIEQTKLYSQWRVRNYKDPHTRVEQITFRPQQPDHFSGPATWDLMTQIEIGDIVTLHTDHPGGGGFDNEDFFVEGIHYDIQPGPEAWADVTLTIDVSPRSLYQYNPFSLNDPPAPSQPAAVGPLSIIGGNIGQSTK